eukprot:jgi/Tetstr1/453379/TSEL_000318.t1
MTFKPSPSLTTARNASLASLARRVAVKEQRDWSTGGFLHGMDGLHAWVAGEGGPWTGLAEWSQPEARWRLLCHTALYIATSAVLMLICAHRASLGERLRAAAAARARVTRAWMGPTPAAQQAPPQTPAELAEPSGMCTEGIPVRCDAGLLCSHRRTSSWESVGQHLRALGEEGWLRSGAWSGSAGAEAVAALAEMSRAQVGELQRFLSTRAGRGSEAGGGEGEEGGGGGGALGALRQENARLEELCGLRGTEATHLRHQLGQAELDKQQLQAKIAASEACRAALERRWRQREEELVTEVANATSTTIRTEARAWELEEELGNLRVRMAVMAADTSRVASNARDTCAALSSSSTGITQVAAGMAWLEDMMEQADDKLRQVATQRDAAAAEARAACAETACLRAALATSEAEGRAHARRAARLAEELEATVADFAAYEADVLLHAGCAEA